MRRRKLTLDPRFATPEDTRILFMDDLGALIRQRRKELGYTQRDVSSMSDLSPRLIGEIEHGKEQVGMDKIIRLLDVLNMTMHVKVEGK